MEALTFLNSPLLWGLGLASIPILIHLLYRRQYRRVDWAPMRYLKLSIQRNRRRIRIEQILLLLLRTALVVILFLLVARPVMHAEGLSRWLGTNDRTNRIVVLDDSLSMGHTQEAKSALSRAQQVLADLLPTFGAKDAFTLVLVSQPTAPVVREVDLENVDQLTSLVRAVRPADVLGAWEPALKSVDDLMASGSYPIYEVTLVTDLRRAGWEDRLADLSRRWAERRVRLRVFDVSNSGTDNVALVSLVQSDRLALVAAPTRFEAQVRNDTAAPLAGLEANWIIDGKATLVRVPEVAPGETLKLPLTATFQDAGQHDVAFELAVDALPADNRRGLVVDVRAGLDILLVDGEPSTEPLGGETDFLALALSLPGDAADAFRVELLTDSEWGSTPATNPDVLVLANVTHLSPEQVELLERQVEAGTGLMIFVGEGVDPDNYNQLLYKAGAGLIGAELVTINDVEFAGILAEASEGSPLAALAQLTPAALARVKVKKTYEVRLPSELPEGVHVLARWNNPTSGPAVVQKSFGDGNVLLWTVAADRAWSDWPTEPSYVLAVREAARAIARSDAVYRAYNAGQTLKVAVPASHEVTAPVIEVPEGKEPQAVTLTAPRPTQQGEVPPGAETSLSYADTRRAGFYKMSWRDSAAGPASQQFAVNPDPRESELTPLSADELRKLWGSLDVEVISLGATGDASLAVRGREIWRLLATCLMGMLVVEACFARWAGRQR